MKRIVLTVVLFNCLNMAFAQETATNDDEPKRGFQKEKMFTGGDVTLSFYTGGTTIGVSPYIGYSLTKWLDAAVSLNFVYQGNKDVYGNKARQTNLGPGAFVRLFPVNFLYAQAQYEHNFINYKYIPQGGGGSYKYKTDVNSLLLGAGYSSGRGEGSNTYFYLSVLFDVLQLPNSPYVDSYGRLIPVIRAGYNIGLFQGLGHQRRRRSYDE